MLKIRRVVEAGTAKLTVRWAIGTEQLPDLHELVRADHTRDIVLDLTEVSLVDMEAIRFLVQCERQGVRLAHCPAYIREWMVREN
jgi:hypothetical protein